MSDSLQPHPWNSPGQNTGVGSLSLLQGVFPTQGLNPGLPHYRRILYQLSHKRSLVNKEKQKNLEQSKTLNPGNNRLVNLMTIPGKFLSVKMD